MRKFKYITEYFLTDKGVIIITDSDRTGDITTFREDIINTIVLIDNVAHRVLGVEYFAIKNINIGSRIGLLVENIDRKEKLKRINETQSR